MLERPILAIKLKGIYVFFNSENCIFKWFFRNQELAFSRPWFWILMFFQWYDHPTSKENGGSWTSRVWTFQGCKVFKFYRFDAKWSISKGFWSTQKFVISFGFLSRFKCQCWSWFFIICFLSNMSLLKSLLALGL